MSEYLVVIEHEGESWGACCPDLPGVGRSATRRTKLSS
jgi:predicted RNase H-like HicB family nuclease